MAKEEENSPIVQTWLNEIDDARKRESDYREAGKKILKIYKGENPDQIPFNILFSNTETLLPALFSQQPRPIVKRRFSTEESPLVEAGAKASTRILEYLLDTNIDGYERFEDTMTSVTLDGLLPGRGAACVEYEAIISGEEGDEETESTEQVEYETCCLTAKKWDRVYYGFAHKWEEVPWLAYEYFMDEEEAKKKFGDKAEKIKFTEGEEKEEGTSQESPDALQHLGERKTAQIFQIWDRSDKTVKYISPQYKEGYLSEESDPLGITGFFNCPRPIQFVEKANDLIPTALFTIYENQAIELNVVQARLSRVIKAIKVRGVYDGALGDELERIMDEDDSELVPTDKGASLVDGGLRNAIWFMPIQELVAVAQQLYQARESCKQVIYEITGISDVLRGSTKASETLGAQKMKESWGTMRIKRLQKRVQDYARDSLRIMLDVAVEKFSVDTWAKVTGLPYPTIEQRDQAKAQLDQMKMQFEQNAQLAQQQGIPPQPFQPDPQLLKAATSPAWEEILELLKDDYIRSYKVDIETNSTLEVEATEDKQLVGEFMNAMAQFLNGIGPLVESGTMPFEAAQAMLTQISRRFRFGDDVEEHLKKMKPPEKGNDPEAEKAQKQLLAEKQKLDKERQTMEQEIQKTKEDFQNQANKLKADKMAFDFERKLAEERLKNQNKLNEELLKMKEQIAATKQDADQKEANEQLKSLIKDGERKQQSMLDKHKLQVSEMLSSSEKEESEESGTTIINQLPDGNKSISINRDESGSIIGADVNGG